MILEPAVEPVEFKAKGTGEVRKFTLMEHTGKELDQYIIDSSEIYDTALEKLRDLGDNSNLTADVLVQIKNEIAEHSSGLIAKLLLPDGGHSINAEWVYHNLTRRQRGMILDKQNDLNGIETVKDQGFLIERLALTNSLAIRREAKRLNSIPASPTGQDDLTLLENLKEQLAPSIPGSESSPESEVNYRIETVEPSNHVGIDELEPDEDGLVQL